LNPERAKILGTIIDKVRIACSLPILEKDDLRVTIFTWNEVLEGIVPTNRLNDCYIWAMRKRDGRHPFSVSELGDAYREIVEQERYRSTVNGPKQLTENSKANCEKCFGTGWEVIKDKGAKKCDHVPNLTLGTPSF
jgi:hypothetical protein